MALLVGLPVVIAVVSRLVSVLAPKMALSVNGESVSGSEMFGLMMWMLYIRFIVPILGVFYGTALMADEVDDRTITYLFTRPIARGAVLLGKYLAYLACTVLLILPSVVVVYFLTVPIRDGSAAAMFPSLVEDLGMLTVGLAAYGAVFAWVGARIRRPLVVGLVFVLGWEPAVLLVPGYLKRLTVAYYLQALVPHAMPADSGLSALLQAFTEVPAVAPSLVALAALTVGALWLAARTVESREYVLEQ
jgi:ABC-2 type transport system permease protein